MKLGRVLLTTTSLVLFSCAPPVDKPSSGERPVLNKVANDLTRKVAIDHQNVAAMEELRRRGAVVREIDYGSFVVAEVSEAGAGGREGLSALPLEVKDDYDLIRLEGYTIDARDPQATYDRLDPSLVKHGALSIVQLVGPSKDEWREQLEGDGVQIITYLAENSYIVRASAKELDRAPKLLRDHEFVQLVADYEPAFKLAPALRDLKDEMRLHLTVQVLDNDFSPGVIATLRSLGEVRAIASASPYLNVELFTESRNLVAIANIDDVFELEPLTARERLDEAQGQILAGNLTGNAPTGPGYLAFLAGKGFDNTQFGSFVVEIADDCYLLTGTALHPDLPATRVAFQNNVTAMSGAQGGHGFLNTTIISGFNNQTGSAFEDANLFNYGLGISPFSRVGITAIFGNGAATPTGWENTAYQNNSRVSSNSWGFTGAAAKKYDANAQEYDRIVRDSQMGTAGLQPMIVVFAAGNDGSAANTVSSPATAKNVITVGASENVRQTGTDGCGIANAGADSANDVISFSSRGPVNSPNDGRIKPDLLAPGTHVESAIPQGGSSNYDGSSVCDQFFPAGQTLYGWSSGTSHSCPAVAGGASLVYQDFLNHGRAAPSPAMVKAYLMNSATYMSGTGGGGNLPSNTQGMGRMNLGVAFDGVARLLVDQTTVFANTGDTFNMSGSVASSAQPFRVTLAWSDAPGPTTGAPFINNLDLTVTIGGSTYRGNVFSGANSVTGGSADGRNNVESVFLPAGATGSFTVTVAATNIAGDGIPGNADATDQDFALVIYNGSSTPPTIGASPSPLGFTGEVGGANPASQSLNITNSGGGTLNWSAVTDQPWLSISPTSGTAPSTPAVSVNSNGLAIGTYHGNVTISASGATNTPLAVPVSFSVQCFTNAECSDGNACNGAETCQSGACAAGTPPNLDDGNACTTDTCNPATGPVHTPVANGTSCSDGNACNGAETCQSGACAAGTPPNLDDGNACTTDTCNPATGPVHTPVANGTSCSDGNACNGAETCQSGACAAGTPPNVDDGNACTTDTCNPATGPVHTPVANGTSCSDGNACNGAETCQSGACAAGTPPNLDDGNACTTDTCNPATGPVHTPVANGTSCSDGNACNGAETCQSGACAAGTPPNIDDGNACTTDTCNPATGPVHTPVANGTSCSDGNACNGAETCQSGACAAGTPPNIDDGNACTTDTCNPATGPVHTPVANGTSCSDGNACNGAETCQSGACAAGTPPNLDDGNACTTDTCNPATGPVHTPVANGTSCSDGNACNGAETCQSGACAAGTPPNLDDGNACTTDTCNPATGPVHTPVANGTSCSDGNACNGAETCQSGACAAGTPPNLDDGNACTTDTCNPATGPVHTPVANGTSCSDGNACNGAETCQSGTCAAGTPPNLDDGNACTTDTCNPATGPVHTPVANGTSCSDGNACNGAETCQSGTCAAGTPPNLDDGNACTTDTCDPATGPVHTPVADGTSCSDGDACNGAETCQIGACAAGTPPNLDDGNACTTDTCVPATGPVHTPVADGTSCSDGNACNGAESCTSGVCTPGTPLPVDDNNPCTTDSCDPSGTITHVPLPAGTACSDGNPANGVETCTASATCVGFDWGDAPDPTYPTLAASNGASHQLSPLFLGATVAAEIDGQPDPNAAADSDDDGVIFTTDLTPNGATTIHVTASRAGKLNAWIDFDGNGNWTDPGDRIFNNQSLVAGVNTLSFLVPGTARAGQTFARFRISTAGGLSFDGPAPDGEVEDYAVVIASAPSLSLIDASTIEGDSGSHTAQVTVTLSAPSTHTVTVLWNTGSGTAVYPVDYAAGSGKLTFTPGVTSQTLNVTVLGDTLYESDEFFYVRLSAPTYATIARGQGTMTIVNDDSAALITVNDVSVVEGNSGTVNAVFTLTISRPSSEPVTVSYKTGSGTAVAGSDYTTVLSAATFPANATTTNVSIAVNGDTTYELDEVFYLNLTSAVGGVIADAQGVATIVNDDPIPTVSIGAASTLEGNTGTHSLNFPVTLSNPSYLPVTVSFTTIAGSATAPSDYVARTSSLLIPNGASSGSIAITINGDTLVEPDETFTVHATGAANATIVTGDAVGTILNDD